MKKLQTVPILLALLSVSVIPVALGEPEAEPLLKLDVPRLAAPKPPLKGSVQQTVTPTPPVAPKPLNGAATDTSKTLNGKANSKSIGGLFKRKPKIDVEVKQDTLNAQAQLGIGIIGVKFVMALGRPPVINRVFPGTPAFEQGLKRDDIIVAVDGVPTFGLTKDEVFNMIVGTPNTPVSISIRHNQDFRVCKMIRMDFNDIKDPQVRRDYQSM
jgi:PDZ domain